MTEPTQSSRFSFWHAGPFALIARLSVGIPFIYLAVAKLQAPPVFLQSLNGYHILPTQPPELINSIAIVMPWLEILIGVCLLAGFLQRGAAWLAFLMLVAFTGAVFVRGIGYIDATTSFMQVKFDCGCGTGEVLLWQKLLGNSGMILASFYLCVTNARLWTLASFERKPERKSASTYAVEA